MTVVGYIQALAVDFVTHGRVNLTFDTRHCLVKWALITIVCDHESQINTQHNINIGKQFTNARLCDQMELSCSNLSVWFGGICWVTCTWFVAYDMNWISSSRTTVQDLFDKLLVQQLSEQESRAAARKPRDAASVLFRWTSSTTFTTSIRLDKLRKRPRFRAPNMLAQNTI